MSHRFLPLLIVIWTCWLSMPEKAQARSRSVAHMPDTQPHLLAQADSDTDVDLEVDLDTEPETEADTGGSLLDGIEEEAPRALMQLGSEGPGVESVQNKLSELGYFDGTVDGIYGADTETAVQQFQEAEGLEPTGRIDLTTWERIQTSNQSLVAEPSGSDASSQPDETVGEAETEAVVPDAAKPEALSASGSAQTEQVEPSWTLKRLLLVGGVAIFGLVAIAGMSLSVWRWLTRPSHPLQKDAAATGLPNPLNPDAINTTAVPIEAGLPSNGAQASSSVGSPPLQPDDVLLVNRDRNSTPANNSNLPSAAQADGAADGEANGSAALQPPNVSPTTRLSKTNLIESLIQDLDSIDSTVRRKAIWQLGQQGTTQAIQPLVNLMIDSDSQQRSLILAALSEIGERTLNPMHRALAMSLQDENAEVRRNAIRDLTRIYDQVAQLAPLLRHAMEDTDPTVRDTAAWALNQLNRQTKQASFQPNSSPAQLNQSSQSDDLWQDS